MKPSVQEEPPSRVRQRGDHLPAVVLGVVLRKMVELGRITQDRADDIAILAMPDACWGLHGVDLESAVERALAPRVWRHQATEARDV